MADRTAAYAAILTAIFATAQAQAAVSHTGTLADAGSVATIPFTLVARASVSAQSFGYGGTASAPGGTNADGAVIAPGGAETVLSLFAGTGDTATFVTSSYAAGPYACPPATAGAGGCLDPQLSRTLDPGAYTLTVTDYANISFAENYGAGTLADGFTGFGSPDSLHSGAYAVDLTLGAPGDGGGGGTNVPTPGGYAIFVAALCLGVARSLIQKGRSDAA